MRRITTWLLSTITALVLLFSYHTSTGAATPEAAASVPDLRAGTESGASGSGSSSSSAPAATTVLGDAVMTRFGNVQVQITVQNGKVTSSEVTQVPWSNGKDQQINAYAVPILNSEAVAAQSADIDMVSGATYTSEGYIQSLQSALDQAGL